MKISSSYQIPLLILAMIATTPQSSYAHLEDIIDVDRDFSEELNKAGCNNSDEDTIKVRQKIYALRSAKFFKDVEFKEDVEIEGDLSVDGEITMNGLPLVNTSGIQNTFVSNNAGNFTMTGTNNSGFGFNALLANAGGSSNTAVGSQALLSNNIGGANTAIGTNAAMANVAGIFNTAVGAGALEDNINGSNNTAVGLSALGFLTIGNSNTAIGTSAGSTLTNGSNNIYIANAGLAAESNTIRIGTLGTQTAAYMQGIFGAAVAVGGLPVEVDAVGKLGTVVSSAQFKKNIQDMDSASDKLRRLRPVTFEYKNDDSHTPQIGLIAEEVAHVLPELVVYDLEGQPYSVRYQILPVLLLQELQRHQDLIDDLTARISQLEDLLNAAA